jgi:hypothetical protein
MWDKKGDIEIRDEKGNKGAGEYIQEERVKREDDLLVNNHLAY